jgi:MGT family glycosyltransferase
MMPLAGPMNGSLHLAKAVAARGHRVVFVGMDDCLPFIEPYGFEFVSIDARWFPRGYMQRWREGGGSAWKSFKHRRRLVLESRDYCRHLLEGGGEFERAMAGLRPDLLVIDGSHRPTWALLAFKAKVKSVYLHTTMPPAADDARPPCFSGLCPDGSPASLAQVRKAWRNFFWQRQVIIKTQTLLGFGYDWMAYTRQLARAFGYPLERLSFRTVFSALLDFPEVILFPRAFDFPGPEMPNRHYIEGAIDLHRQEPDFPWARLDESRQLVYCSLGSIHHDKRFFQAVLDAAAREPGWQLVLNLGDAFTAADFPAAPANAMLVNRAPQLGLLCRAKVMITHGGINSIRECVYFGVPMVVFPVTFDQPGASARVQYHRLGLVGSLRKVSADDIHRLTKEAMGDASIRERLGKMAEVFRQVEAEQPGVRLIEQLARVSPAA